MKTRLSNPQRVYQRQGTGRNVENDPDNASPRSKKLPLRAKASEPTHRSKQTGSSGRPSVNFEVGRCSPRGNSEEAVGSDVETQDDSENECDSEERQGLGFFIDTSSSTVTGERNEQNDVEDECEPSQCDHPDDSSDSEIEEMRKVKFPSADVVSISGKSNSRGNTRRSGHALQSSLDLSDTYTQAAVYSHTQALLNPRRIHQLTDKDKLFARKRGIKTDFRSNSTVPSCNESVRELKRQRRVERAKTKGSDWFHLPAPDITDEIKNDLKVLTMRSVLDPHTFYKDDTKTLPKYFQMGKLVESKADFYHARVPKKQRQSTIVDELLVNDEFRSYNKRKYEEAQGAKLKSRGAFRHMKRLKKK